MTYENWLTYTEVDVGADHIQRIGDPSYHIDHYSIRNEDAYVYKDFGADHFGDFEHLVDCQVTNDHSGNYPAIYPWMVSNDIDDVNGLTIADKTFLYLAFGYAVGNRYILIREVVAGTEYIDLYSGYSENQMYYFRVKKNGTAFTVRIWTNSTDRDNNDIGAGSYVDELSLTLHSDWKFRYMFSCNTYNSGVTDHQVGDIENLDLQEAVVVAPSGSVIPILEAIGILTAKPSKPKPFSQSFKSLFPKFRPRLVI